MNNPFQTFFSQTLPRCAGEGRVGVRTSVLTLSALLTLSPIVWAQTERSGNSDARVMQQLQQLTSERASLQAENARLKQELEAARKDLGQAASGRKAAESRLKALEANASRGEQSSRQAVEQLEHTRAQMQELIAKFRETAQSLRDTEAERTQAKNQLAAREREFQSCVDRNAGLYNLNTEVLDKLENRGFWSNLAEREPFTRIKRVELENLIDDYKYRAEELRLQALERTSSDK